MSSARIQAKLLAWRQPKLTVGQAYLSHGYFTVVIKGVTLGEGRLEYNSTHRVVCKKHFPLSLIQLLYSSGSEHRTLLTPETVTTPITSVIAFGTK